MTSNHGDSNSSVASSYVDVNLDSAAQQQKYVTFDSDEEGKTTLPSYNQSSANLPVDRAPPAAAYTPPYTPASYDPQFKSMGSLPGQDQQCLALEPPKFEQLKKWTVTNYKYTKQLVGEKFGHSTRTVDKDLEERIVELKLAKVHYANLLKESRNMLTKFEQLVLCHRNMRTQFQTMIAQAPELQEQLQSNAATQSVLEKNGEGLLGALRTFVESLTTLVNITIQDTFYTIKNYENSRIEYDAYRNDISTLQNAIPTDITKNKMLELQVVFEDRKQKWEKLKNDTTTKMNLLHENKIMVMRSQLDMFNNAVIAYFSGNGDKLNEVLSEYHIRTRKVSEDDNSSFLTRPNE